MFQDQLSSAGLALPSMNEEPEQHEEEPMREDNDLLAEDLLTGYGTELLSAYNDPQVHVMQAISNELDESQSQASVSK